MKNLRYYVNYILWKEIEVFCLIHENYVQIYIKKFIVFILIYKFLNIKNVFFHFNVIER